MFYWKSVTRSLHVFRYINIERVDPEAVSNSVLLGFRDVIFGKLVGAPLSCGLGPRGLPGPEVRRGLAVCFGQGNSRAEIPVKTVSSQALF